LRSLHRAVDILLCFKTVGPELGVAEISRACVLDKSTASRIAGDLCERQFLQRDPHSGKYRLGPQLLALAEAARGHIDLRREALPHMRWLWEQLGETIRLSVVRGMERVCIEQIESRHELRRGHRAQQAVPDARWLLRQGAAGPPSPGDASSNPRRPAYRLHRENHHLPGALASQPGAGPCTGTLHRLRRACDRRLLHGRARLGLLWPGCRLAVHVSARDPPRSSQD